MKFAHFAAAAVLAVGASTVAHAGLSNATVASDASTSRKGLASLTGAASFDDATGKLTVTVTNTSASGRGYLTGLAFNAAGNARATYVDGDDLATRKDEDAYDNLKMKKKLGGAKAKPFGVFDAGVGLDGKWNGRGARRGVAAGASHMFVFDVSGADADAAVTDLMGGDGLSLYANFKGFKKGKRDTVGARLTLLTASDTTDTSADPIVVPPSNIQNGANGTPNGGNTSANGGLDGGSGGLNGGNGGINNGGGLSGGNQGGQLHAVPLPPAAWPGLGMIGLLATNALRRRLAAH